MISTEDIAREVFGDGPIYQYARVKRFYMILGGELATAFAVAVGGRPGVQGSEPDVITRLGAYEFCASHNTKNHAGAMFDAARGLRVQATGKARPGWMSGEDFLLVHAVAPASADSIRRLAGRRAGARLDALASLGLTLIEDDSAAVRAYYEMLGGHAS